MGQRNRKRGQRQRPASPPARQPAGAATRPQKPTTTVTTTKPSATAKAAPDTAHRSRSEERNQAARDALSPLDPGERPWPIRVSAMVAFVLGAATLVLYLAGHKLPIGGKKPSLAYIVIYCGLMFTCAAGTWLMRYWAVLGFQTLLAIGVLGFSLALIRVTSVVGGVICVTVIVGGGYLFWKLVRVLGRLQLPTPPSRR